MMSELDQEKCHLYYISYSFSIITFWKNPSPIIKTHLNSHLWPLIFICPKSPWSVLFVAFYIQKTKMNLNTCYSLPYWFYRVNHPNNWLYFLTRVDFTWNSELRKKLVKYLSYTIAHVSYRVNFAENSGFWIKLVKYFSGNIYLLWLRLISRKNAGLRKVGFIRDFNARFFHEGSFKSRRPVLCNGKLRVKEPQKSSAVIIRGWGIFGYL